MSQYYNPQRSSNLYDPSSTESFRLSRTKIDLFLECPKCFYLDRRLGVGRPPGYPFNLNSAVDTLLKKEFDSHRVAGTVHPLVKEYGVNLIPFSHNSIDEWRDSLRRGITYNQPQTNLVITGGVDDVWVDPRTKELVIVDYKATSKQEEVNLDADWQIGYKRQMEIYQWLFRKNGFKVSSTGYFVYCNGRTDHDAFNARLEFDISLLPYTGNDSWVEQAIIDAHKCLSGGLPNSNPECDYCRYCEVVNKVSL